MMDSTEMFFSVPQGLPSAWDTVTAALVSPVSNDITMSDESLSEGLSLLCSNSLGQFLEGWLMETLQVRLTTAIAPEFWAGMKQPENELEEKDRARILLMAFRTLLDRLQPFLGGLERLGTWQDEGRGGLCGPGARGLRERAFSVIRAILLFSPSAVLQERILEFYSRTFSVHMTQEGERGGSVRAVLSPLSDAGVSKPWSSCKSSANGITYQQVRLFQLALLNRIVQISEIGLGTVPNGTGSGAGVVGQPANAVLQRWRCHMHQFFCRIYVNMRIEELFSIIRDFPESKPAIDDLKFCLERTNQRQQLLTSLKTAFDTRLLHPGVHTSDIITVYISAIKALRELDPSMVILQVACQPIRKYLRTREDTVRQIVASLTGDAEGCSDLANELSRADPVTLETQDSEDEGSDPEEWTPDPKDAVTDKTGSKRRSSDIITLLVSIYGSKEIFIDEYRTVLADRLLHQFNYNTAREIRNVELLKLRFGESHMHYCEVMLKDVADSRRINTNIREEESRLAEEEQPPLSLSAMILSSEFWPTLKEEKMELPPLASQAMEAYTHRYEKLKAMRTLSWKPHLGLVTLDVELEDRTLTNLTVSPIHAAIILHFQDKSSWTLEELSGVLGVPQEMVRRKLALWQQQGVLKEEAGGRYSVLETGSSRERPERGVMLIDSDEEGDSNTTTQSEQREEKLQLFWAYIQAMLTNLETMTLERIHSMLRMFVATGPIVTEMDVNELQAFLQRKVRDHQLIMSAGIYRLPKSTN
uniref:Anaphase-promoting complex subunit 2 n=1 Tax=Oncorhynchus tshawytscha TaxID=74940 RepID=A0A8C8D2X4_ONCTS